MSKTIVTLPGGLAVDQTTQNTVAVIQRTSTVEVTRTRTTVVGVQGPPGKPGEGAAETYVHQQDAPASLWNVPHGLGRWPSVTVVDSSGDVVIGQPTYVNQNLLRIAFSAPFSGRAYLN